jgi:hypothetical protein
VQQHHCLAWWWLYRRVCNVVISLLPFLWHANSHKQGPSPAGSCYTP